MARGDKLRAKSRYKHRPDGSFAKGTAPGPGRGPAKGAPNAGRPHDAFKAEMQRILMLPAVLARIERLATKPGTKADLFLRVLQFAADRSWGKPTQPIDDLNLSLEEREARVRALLGLK